MVINRIVSNIEYLNGYNYLTTYIISENLSIKFWKQARLYNKWEIYIDNKKIIQQSEIITTPPTLGKKPSFYCVRFPKHIHTYQAFRI